MGSENCFCDVTEVPIACVPIGCVPIVCVPIACVPIGCVPIACVPIGCVRIWRIRGSYERDKSFADSLGNFTSTNPSRGHGTQLKTLLESFEYRSTMVLRGLSYGIELTILNTGKH